MASNYSDSNPYTSPTPADSAGQDTDDSATMREIGLLRRQIRYLYVMVIALFVLLIIVAEDISDPDVVVWTVVAGVVIAVMSVLLLRPRSSS